ncbi:MAG TPA: DEAD/DEAH box helicase [Acidimicrobiales bacterium]|nr:DEAD/DEAH box helicase [Acidimicrobiales bacterium]
MHVVADRLLEGIEGDRALIHLERLPARAARHRQPLPALPPAVAERLPGPLWSHQAEAVELARAGSSVVVSTGTASGKSLCYQLPIAEAILDAADGLGPQASALCLYPTKALAHDQLRSMTDLGLPGVVAACYDGDTEPSARAWTRRWANVVLTNPDMLHAGLLPHHVRWATFLSRLRYVVVDEMHTLRGIYGSHVAHVLRRLRRLCEHYGAEPAFLFGSATVGDPATLARALCGKVVVPVTDDGSPRGQRFFALWSPPVIDPVSGERASAHSETASLLARLVAGGSRVLAFCRSRAAAETVAAEAVRRAGTGSGASIRSYRGGYLPLERRAIEAGLASGHLRGVVATSALELGVDIGGLDACLLDGFPGTISSMWQQAGRAGRNQERSLAVLVAGEDQLDRWLMAHPDEVFSRPPEPAVVNPANPFVAQPHLACAAYERPLEHDDDRWWEDLDEGIRHLVAEERLVVRDGRGYWAGRGSPAHAVSLRSASAFEYRIADHDGSLVGTVDASRAFTTVHPGAVYLHQGRAYRVDELDVVDGVAWVSPTTGDEVTQPRSETAVEVLQDEQCVPINEGAQLHLGAVAVRQHVVGYQRRSALTRRRLGSEILDLPPTCLVTRAFWYTVDHAVLDFAGVDPAASPGSLHAVEHAAIGILPLFSLCDRWDVGGLSTARHADTGRATILIYDGYPGGAGIAELGFAAGLTHLRATLEVISTCRCSTGCPSCVQSPKCGNWNEPLDKAGAVAILEAVLAS